MRMEVVEPVFHKAKKDSCIKIAQSVFKANSILFVVQPPAPEYDCVDRLF
ncbi:hypothetical protein [Neobacillus mesonae]|nr:hypothetical protein [Neobacillus mesonae]MCM3568175.1 hypothetical protein [Neobacillus mesonae]